MFSIRPWGRQRSLSERRLAKDESSWYDRGFWLIVAAEVALFQAGFQVLRALDAPPQASVGWIALVVGAHFVAFARLWREPSIAAVGVIVFALGAAGLAMSNTSGVAWAPFVSGVLSGFVLLTGCLAAVIADVMARQRFGREQERSRTCTG